MSKSLPAKTRKKLLNRVTRGKVSVAQACREFKVSRFTFYKWFKRSQQGRGFKDKPRRIRKFWRQSNPSLIKEVRQIALVHPDWSKYRIQKALPLTSDGQPLLGLHGVYNILKRLSLATTEKRQLQAELQKDQRPRVLEASERLNMIERVLRGGATVTQVCRELNISRFTFYKWLKRYQKAPETAKLFTLNNKERKVVKWWRQATPGQEELILKVVVESPALSKYKIAERIQRIVGQPTLGSHGVYNVLRRLNLTLPKARIAYAERMKPVFQPIPWLDRLRLVWEQFIPSLAPAPPPAFSRRITGFTKTLFASFFATAVFSFLLLYFFGMLSGQPASVRLGLSFATISLLVGSFFFLYSMKYYFTLALVLSFSTQTGEVGVSGELKEKGTKGWLARIFNLGNSQAGLPLRSSAGAKGGGLQANLDHITLSRHPFISIHLPFYNERRVANRIISACTSFDYPNYEVIVCDDSNDETVEIVKEWENHPRVKILHRPTREGFKGGALSYALKALDPRTEFVCVFDADFVPYPDTLTQFMKYFKATGGWQENLSYQGASLLTMPYQTNEKVEINPSQQLTIDHQLSAIRSKNSIAVVAGYQWHVLNKSENWITRGVRTEYAGSYVIERPGQEILGAMKIIHGSVYCMRADVLKHFGWGTSITEDFELTLRIYEKGFKVVYTPYIQAPSECVSTIKRLIRQRMRWAEGHSYNTRKQFLKLLFSPHLTFTEKLEFLYLSPYYLQAAFFLLGTFSWLISETLFAARLPFWTSLWGWSLVLTNFFALPLVNAVGLFLEESEEKDYLGLLSFVALCYIVVPFQAYAAIKGFIEPKEGTWFRTPKTGNITDIFSRGRFYRWLTGILPFRPAAGGIASSRMVDPQPLFNPYFTLATSNNRFANFKISRRQIRFLGRTALVFLLILATSLSIAGSTVNLLGNPSEKMGQPTTTGIGGVKLSGDQSTEEVSLDKKNEPASGSRRDFNANQTPNVNFKFKPQEKKKEVVSDLFTPGKVEASSDSDFSVSLLDPLGRKVEVELDVVRKEEGGFEVKVPVLASLTPGIYKLKATLIQEGKTYNQEQDFSWGVLAVNTNKSIYLPGEQAKLALAVLDEEGRMVCDALLRLEIKSPEGKSHLLSTEEETIKVNPECQIHDFTLRPDYEAQYQVGEAGTYEMELVAQTKNGTYTINDSFEVRENVAFDIERETATRIYPLKSYPVKFKIKTNQDFIGVVEESVPADFIISPQPDFEIKTIGVEKVLAWRVGWEKGKIYELSYEFDAPDTSPQFYLLGSFTLINWEKEIVFQEARPWQIAVDSLGQLILLWDGVTPPTGWDCISCTGGDAYYQIYPRGMPTYQATTSGSLTNTHTVSRVSGSDNSAGNAYDDNATGTNVPAAVHAHTTLSAQTIGNGSNEPTYRTLKFIRSQSSSPTTIPSGTIGMFDTTSLPTNWSAYSSQNTYYLKGDGTIASSATTTHNHSVSITAAATGTAAEIMKSGSTSTGESPTHTHPGSGTSSNFTNQPAYIETVFAQATQDTSIPSGLIAMFDAAAPSGWDSLSETTGSFYGKFIVGNSAAYGSTGGSYSHIHDNLAVTLTATANTTATADLSPAQNGATVGHTHANFTVSFDRINHLPPYRDTVFAKKQIVANVAQAHYRWRNDDGKEALAGWPYRKPIIITGATAEQTSYQVPVTVSYVSGKMNSDFSDIRFTSSDEDLLPHWRESYTSSSTALFWVEIPTIPASPSTVTIYMYYGNTSAITASDGDTTFIFFDDFPGSSLDASKWDSFTSNGGSITVSGGIVDVYTPASPPSTAVAWIQQVNTNWGYNRAMKFRGEVFNGLAVGTRGDLGFCNSTDCDPEYGTAGKYGVALNYVDSWTHTYAGFWVENNGSATHSNYNIDTTAYHVYQIAQIPSAGYLYVDNSATPTVTTTLTTPTTNMGVHFRTATVTGYATPQHHYIDWVFIRQYVSAEPSVGSAGSEETGGGTWKEVEDTQITNQSKSENVRVRFSVNNTGASTSYSYRLEVAAKTADTCELQTTGWAAVPNQTNCTGADVACMTTSTKFADGDATTRQLSIPGSSTFTAGKMVEDSSNQTTAITLDQNYFTEVEYNFQFTTNAADSTTYCFRVSNAGSAITTYTNVATVVTIPEKLLLALPFLPFLLKILRKQRRKKEKSK